MSWRTKAALDGVGLAAPHHRSRQATAADLGHAALVIALAPEHVHWVRRTNPEAAGAHRHAAAAGPRPPGRPTRRCRPRGAPRPGRGGAERVGGGHRPRRWRRRDLRRLRPRGGGARRRAGPPTRLDRGDDMTERCTADEAAAHVRPVDTIGMPLGPGQPPAFLDALGRRTDWEDLRIGGALLTVLTDLFSHPNVHYLSGFYGPLERLLRDSGANIGFAPADFRRFTPILEASPPRIMCTAAAPPDADGWCSLSLHAGASVGPAPRRRRRSRPAPRRRGRATASRGPSGSASTGTPCTSTRSTCSSRATGRRRHRGRAAHRRRPGHRRARPGLRARRRHPADRHRRGALHRRHAARRGARRRVRHPLRDVHHRPHAPAPGRQGHQPEGHVRRRVGGHVRGWLAGALRLAPREPRGRLPACRPRELARGHRPQPGRGHDQRGHVRRHPRSGDRRHDQRGAVLRHRRPRGLRRPDPPSTSRTGRSSACRRPSRSATSCAPGSCPGSRRAP